MLITGKRFKFQKIKTYIYINWVLANLVIIKLFVVSDIVYVKYIRQSVTIFNLQPKTDELVLLIFLKHLKKDENCDYAIF